MPQREPLWPVAEEVIGWLRRRMAEQGAELRIVSPQDLEAGFARPRLAWEYDPEASLSLLAALHFDGLATRHPLLDGNKRLAWLSAVVFLDLNGLYLDAPEGLAYETGMKVIAREKSVDDLATFFEYWLVVSDG